MATIYHDVFQSITRRRLQAEKDEKTLAAPVRLYPLTGFNDDPRGPFLNLRPRLERVLGSVPRVRSEGEREARRARWMFRHGHINKTQMRQAVRLNDPREFVQPTAAPRARDTRYNRRLARRKAKAAA